MAKLPSLYSVDIIRLEAKQLISLFIYLEEEERKRFERKESNKSGHANPLYDSDIDEE